MGRGQLRGLHLHVPGHRADPEGVSGVLDAGEAGHPADVDQYLGGGEPHVERRHQALPPGENPRAVAAFVEHPEDVVEGLGRT